MSSSVYTNPQEEQKKHQGDEIHTNVDQFTLLNRGFVAPIPPWAKANLDELIKCCLEFLNIKNCPFRHVLFAKRPLNATSLIGVMHRLIKRSHCLGFAPCLLMMLKDWAISQLRYLTSLPFLSVVKPPFSCQIPMVSAAHWLTPTLAFWAQRWTCCVGIGIVLASATTDFCNQKASHDIVCSQQWSMIKWWIKCSLLLTSIGSAEYINEGNAVW